VERESINIYAHVQVRTKKEGPDIFIINYSNILVYDAVSSGEYLQLFRRNIMSPSSWQCSSVLFNLTAL